jgi:hypothetical protein
MGSNGSKNNSSSYNLDRNKLYSNDTSQQTTHEFRTQSPLIMPIQQTFKCHQCGMVFPTDEALYKHRSRFCIGLKDSGVERNLYYSDDEEINGYTSRARLRTLDRNQSPVNKVISS